MRGLLTTTLLLSSLACGRSESATPSTAVLEAGFASKHIDLVRDNPPGLSLELRVDSEQARFRLGEPIPLVITFSSNGFGVL